METNYDGNDINDGYTDPKMLYLGSCQSFCESKYPTTTHYTLVTPRAGPGHTSLHNTCWCKSANSVVYAYTGMIAGESYCAGNDLKRSFFVGRAYTNVAKPMLSFQLKGDGLAGKVGETALPHVAREHGRELDTTLEAGDLARVSPKKLEIVKVRFEK